MPQYREASASLLCTFITYLYAASIISQCDFRLEPGLSPGAVLVKADTKEIKCSAESNKNPDVYINISICLLLVSRSVGAIVRFGLKV